MPTQLKTVTESIAASTPVVEIRRGGVEILDRLAREWRELCLEGPGEQPFYRPEWVAAYVRNCVPQNKLLVVAARNDGKLTAVLPLIREKSLFLSSLPVRKFRGASQPYCWRFDLVRARGAEGEAAVDAVWRALRGLPGWDVIELPDVPRGGAAEQLLESARIDGFPIGRDEGMFTPFKPLSRPHQSDSSQFLPRSMNLQRSLRRILRKMPSRGKLELERYEKPSPVLLQRFYDLERAGWKGKEGTAIVSQATTRNFFDELGQVAGQYGYLSLYFLTLDGQDMAGHFGLCYGGKYFMIKCAYDESFAEYAPGHLLVSLVLRDCSERGLAGFDFMANAEEWKQKWTEELHPHAFCFIFRNTFYGRVLQAVKFGFKPTLKRIIHTGDLNRKTPGTCAEGERRPATPRADGGISKEVAAMTAVVKAELGGIEMIERLADQWRVLCKEGPSNEPFYRPEWIAAYLRAFAPGKEVLLLTARVSGELKAVLPLLQERTIFSGIPARKLRSAGDLHSCRFDLVRGAGPDGVTALLAIWNHLKRMKHWDLIELENVPLAGGVEQLTEAARRDGFLTGWRETMRSPFIPLTGGDGSEEWWLKRVDSKFRSNLRRRLRKLAAEGPFVLRRYDTADPGAIQRFYDLEGQGWKGREGTAIACQEETRRFYNEVARNAARFGYFSLYLLEWKGQLLAGHFGLTQDGRYFVPKLAYGENYVVHGPGHLMINAVLRDCVERGISEFDFLGDTAPWKEEWTSEFRQLVSWYVFRPDRFGRLLYTIKFRVKPVLRELLQRS